MGAEFDRVAALDRRVHASTYARKPVLLVEGRGMRLTGDDGRRYLDFIAGYGSVNLGHCHPAVTDALCTQAGKLVQPSNMYYAEHRSELAADLVELMGGGCKVWFQNSGTEAVEGAIKLARKWAKENRGPDAVEIVTALRSFHGRTYAGLSATGQPEKRAPFEPVVPGFRHVPLNDVDALDAAVGPACAAVMLEPIQGEGGVWPCTPEYLRAAEGLCRERGVLFVLDEVQTGFYRTGPVFAHKGFGVEPDIMALAKSLANGLPIGAVVGREDVVDSFQPGDHGTTFGGGPAVCAAGRATLRELAEAKLGENAVRVGEYLRAGLRDLAEKTGAISDVRGIGLMNAAHLREPRAAEVAERALDRGFLLNSIGPDILRFLPPLVCGRDEADALLGIVQELLS